MNISGPYRVHGPHALQGPHMTRPPAPASNSEAAQGADQVEISPAAEAAIRASDSGDIRTALVERVRGELAAGIYETPAKLDAALDRLLDEIG
jgi:negative regulator of flagellin synthesis FlgM